MNNIFFHRGVPELSGRYDWGSGMVPYQRLRREGRLPWGDLEEDPYASEESFSKAISYMKSKGYSETEIASDMKINTSQLRKTLSINKQRSIARNVNRVNRLKNNGYTESKITELTGIPEATVREYLKDRSDRQYQVLDVTKRVLKDAVDKKSYIDVGLGVETQLGVSRPKLDLAIKTLENEGYHMHYIDITTSSGKRTRMKVLVKPGLEYSDLIKNRYNVGLIQEYSRDSGHTYFGIAPPASVDPKRLGVRWGEEGSKKDGLIEIRRGSRDLTIGTADYAQVRVKVGDNHYIKGVAVYSDDLPSGIDIMFNTNKPENSDKLAALKELKPDEDNPFGSYISRQVDYIDKNGKSKLSPMNLVYEEGDWDLWSKSLSSQFLSKQSPRLAKAQLGLEYEKYSERKKEIDGIQNLEVKRHLLWNLAEDADKAAVDLKAAPVPGQSNSVLIPVPSMKDNEIYAPRYKNGATVALIRHPHGGIFEIPVLRVNNKNPDARSVMGIAPDAVGINPSVAKVLSGADFDGDTVIVIPNDKREIKTSPPVKDLLDFDPKISYREYPGMPVMTEDHKQITMGVVSNLITDMTLMGAPVEEIVRAVKHSMVVIDAPKHHLNWKLSEEENGIQALKKKYQTGGASTLISRAGSTVYVPERKEGTAYYVDPKTGKKIVVNTNRKYLIKKADGTTEERLANSRIERLAKEDDAFNLVSKDGGTLIERIYAEHSNKLKELANTTRLQFKNEPTVRVDPKLAEEFSEEIKSLKAKISLVLRTKPHERRAQLLATKIIKEKLSENPEMYDKKDKLKRFKGMALVEARSRVGLSRPKISLTEREWQAIDMGAVSTNVIQTLLLSIPSEVLEERYLPKTSGRIPQDVRNKAKLMLSGKYTYAEIAERLGISVSSVVRIASE